MITRLANSGLSSVLLGLAMFAVSGCETAPTIQPPPPFTQYTNGQFDWHRVQRVVVMPVANRSQYPRVADQFQEALVTELQRTGRFETVAAPFDVQGPKSADVFTTGRFDEIELLNLSRRFQAQAVVFARITQYHPYDPPRLGMSLMMVSPAEASVIASVDGMWDGRDIPTTERGESYFDRTQEWPNSLFEKDLVRTSPRVFQRFVAYQVAKSIANTTMPSNGGSDIQFVSGSMPHATGIQSVTQPIFVESDGTTTITPVPANHPAFVPNYPLGEMPIESMGPEIVIPTSPDQMGQPMVPPTPTPQALPPSPAPANPPMPPLDQKDSATRWPWPVQ